MDRSEVITLLAAVHTQDENGIWREKLTGRDVFARVESVTRQEFYEAGRNGLNPDYRMTMFAYDYQGETLIRYKGKTYAVYRTYYAKSDVLELYVQREGGANGKHEES